VEAGTYTVTVTGNACNTTASVVVNVMPANFGVSVNTPINVCPGQPIPFNSTVSNLGSFPPNGIAYDWDGPNGYNSAQADPTINNSNAGMSGTYTVNASAGGCSVSANSTVTVYSASINPNVLQNGQLVYCLANGETQGPIEFFLSNPSYSSQINNYVINWGDGTSETITSANFSSLMSHSFLPGSYSIVLTMNMSNGCSTSTTYTAFIGSTPSPASLQLFANQCGETLSCW
jgi:hypothetical protein